MRVLKYAEGIYKKCQGAVAGQDEDLRLLLVDFANTILDELNNYRAWRLDYVLATLNTAVAPTAVYPRPTGLAYISNVYYVKSSGTPVEIHSGDPMQIRKTYGEFPNAAVGPPLYYELQGNSIQFYPTPDTAGPGALGVYPILFEGSSPVLHIVETTGNTAASTTLTVPSTGYLVDEGVTTSGAAVSIRGAGNLAVLSVNDTFVTSWSAFAGTTVTLGSAPIKTNAVNAQTFFNSQNWIISNFPNVLAFGMLREIASYLKDAYEIWEQRYQAQVQLMEEFDAATRQGAEQLAFALAGQLRVQYKDLDVPQIYDVRP